MGAPSTSTPPPEKQFQLSFQLYFYIGDPVLFYYTLFTFTFMHLADAFIQSNLQLHSGYTFLSVHVFPGNRTHNLCAANAML